MKRSKSRKSELFRSLTFDTLEIFGGVQTELNTPKKRVVSGFFALFVAPKKFDKVHFFFVQLRPTLMFARVDTSEHCTRKAIACQTVQVTQSKGVSVNFCRQNFTDTPLYFAFFPCFLATAERGTGSKATTDPLAATSIARKNRLH